MRINRFIAACTKLSRRQADKVIKSRRIEVNGQIMTDLSFQVVISDQVKMDGNKLVPFNKVYYLVNKPIGVTVSKEDKHAKKLILDFVPANPPVFPVGRLDKDSSGLILLTNDGDLAQELTHPKFVHEKEYLVGLDMDLSESDINKLKHGIDLEEGRASFDKITKQKACEYKVVIHQGWYRQIRRMFEQLGREVVVLKRVRIAGITLGGLPEGKWVEIKYEKLKKLIK